MSNTTEQTDGNSNSLPRRYGLAELYAVYFRNIFDAAFESEFAALNHIAHEIVSGDKSPREHWEISLFKQAPPESSVAPLKAVTIIIPSGYRDAAEFLKDCQFERAPGENIDAMRQTLEWLDRMGGLGYEAHNRIRDALGKPCLL